MRNTLKILFAVLMIIGCNSVPITGRRQLNLLPESQMIGMSATAYTDFLSSNPPASSSNRDAQMVRNLGNKLANAATDYCKNHSMAERVEGFAWEFNLVDDPAVNAWCMPGGKVVVYTGIMDVAETELGLAVVMGHEIAHAIARHGNERMSTNILAQAGLGSLDAILSQKPTMANDLMLKAAGVGTQLGTLKFSRNHESEADKMGLIFMSMAGYDPNEAPKFWERMAAASGGAPPEFLSTHPSAATRVADLKAYMPEAMKYYQK
ncbi:MAG: putative Zn-dependent protease [Patiriisocius sp.]|jgi:predicted Zn-dependent protease